MAARQAKDARLVPGRQVRDLHPLGRLLGPRLRAYGDNRAESLAHYNSARTLVTILVDIVSRGGKLLLDIGPDAEGTIPVIMEERLAEIGAWLAVNGEAIYGTRPHTVVKQWSEGEVPKLDHNKEYDTVYDVAQLTAKPAPGKASIEPFFTRKAGAVYAVLPRWPGRRFVWKDAASLRPKAVSLLGAPGALRFTRSGATIAIELEDLPEELLGPARLGAEALAVDARALSRADRAASGRRYQSTTEPSWLS